MLQLLWMTDVTDMQTVPAAPPTQMAASGVMTRNAFRQTVTAAWSVLNFRRDVTRVLLVAPAYHPFTVFKGEDVIYKQKTWGVIELFFVLSTHR